MGPVGRCRETGEWDEIMASPDGMSQEEKWSKLTVEVEVGVDIDWMDHRWINTAEG